MVGQLIAGGQVFDGSGEAPFVADVGVTDGRIVFIGDADSANVTSSDVIDAAGPLGDARIHRCAQSCGAG